MSDILNSKALKSVLNATWSVRMKWHEIGIQLEYDLKVVQKNYENIDDRFTEIISLWLHQNSKPTWGALVEALTSPPVDSINIALAIQEQYIHIPVSETVEKESSFLEDIEPDQLLKEQIEKLDIRFSDLVYRTEKSLESSNKFSVSFLRKLFARFPSTRRHEHKEFLDRYIFKKDPNFTAEDLWLSFSNYWHFINYALLKFIVDYSSSPEDLSSDMKQYDTDMQHFCEETSMHDFVKCFPVLYQQGLVANKPHSISLDMKVKNESGKFKLVHLNRLESDFVTTFSLPKICGLILKHISRGCFIITWSVPTHYSKLLRWKLNICDQHFFDKHDIESANLNQELCYCKGKKRIPINPAHEVVSNLTITREVFDLRAMMERVIVSSPPFTVTQLCTAYICKLLTQHLSTHSVYGEKGLCIRAINDLPHDVHRLFLHLCKVAHTEFKEQIPQPSFKFRDLTDRLGLSIQEGSHKVIHHTIFEYLASFYIAKCLTGDYQSSTGDMEVFSIVNALLNSNSFVPYFVAGLRQWTQSSYVNQPNHLLFKFEVSCCANISLFSLQKYWQKHTDFKTWIDAVCSTEGELVFPSITSHSSIKSFTRKKYGHESIQSDEKFITAYKLFIWGQIIFTCELDSYSVPSCLWHSDHESILKEHLTAGIIAASEYAFKVSKGLLHFRNFKIQIAVDCTTPDFNIFMSLPYSTLRRVADLTFHSQVGGVLESSYSTSDLTEYLEPLAGLLQRNSTLLQLRLRIQDLNQFTNALTEVVLKNSGNLKKLDIEQTLTSRSAATLCGLIKTGCLSDLNISYQKIGSGADISAVCNALIVNTTLVSLKLQIFTVKFSDTHDIGKMLSSNQSLKELHLASNDIKENGAQALAEGLSVNKTLHEVNLSDNKIQSGGAKAIAETLKVNTYLKSLDLSKNSIEDDGAQALAYGLSTHHNITLEMLRSIYTNLNKYHGSLAIEFLPLDSDSTLSDAQALACGLTSIQLKYQSLSYQYIKQSSHQNAFSLNKLNLSGNNIQSDGARAIAKALKVNNCLTSLDLSKNNIDDDGAHALADGFTLNLTLVELGLSGNKIQNNGAKSLATALAKNISLRFLDVSMNKIGDDGAIALSEMMKSRKLWIDVNVDDNTGITEKTFKYKPRFK